MPRTHDAADDRLDARTQPVFEFGGVLFLALRDGIGTGLAVAACEPNPKLAEVYRRRCRPEFGVTFRAWLAQRPFSDPAAIPGPLYMPQYLPSEAVRAAELDAEAEKLYREGVEAKEHDDAFTLSTVFFAAVLFFASVALRVEWWPLRIGVFALGSLMLIVGLAWVATQPTA